MGKKRASKEQYVSLIKFEVEMVFFFKDRSAWNEVLFFFFKKRAQWYLHTVWQTIMKTFTHLDYLENDRELEKQWTSSYL